MFVYYFTSSIELSDHSKIKTIGIACGMKDLRRRRIQGAQQCEAESTERYPQRENWSSNLNWSIVHQVEDKEIEKKEKKNPN